MRAFFGFIILGLLAAGGYGFYRLWVSTSAPIDEAIDYQARQDAQTAPEQIIYTEGTPLDPGFRSLRAVAFAQGRLYVAGDQTLAVFDAAGRPTAFRLDGVPTCLAVAPDGEIYVGMTGQVEVLTADGTLKACWSTFGTSAYITSLAVDAESLYAADAGNRIVWRCQRSDGKVLQRIGARDDARHIPGLVVPSPYMDLALDDKGALWVVNPGRHALEQYSATGDLVTSWQKEATGADGFCGCCNPTHIAILPDGGFVTSEKGIARVKVYGRTGEFRGFVAGAEQFSSGLAGLDLAVGDDGRVFVLDPGRRVVRVFVKKAAVAPAKP